MADRLDDFTPFWINWQGGCYDHIDSAEHWRSYVAGCEMGNIAFADSPRAAIDILLDSTLDPARADGAIDFSNGPDVVPRPVAIFLEEWALDRGMDLREMAKPVVEKQPTRRAAYHRADRLDDTAPDQNSGRYARRALLPEALLTLPGDAVCTITRTVTYTAPVAKMRRQLMQSMDLGEHNPHHDMKIVIEEGPVFEVEVDDE